MHDTEIRDRADAFGTAATATTSGHAVGVGIRNMWRYQGPVARLRLLTASRFASPPPPSSSPTNQTQIPISHLLLTDAVTTKSLISALERLGSLDSNPSSPPPQIKMLSVEMHVWTVEVLYAIRGLFRECVQEVRVEFGVGGVGKVSFLCVFLLFFFVVEGM